MNSQSPAQRATPSTGKQIGALLGFIVLVVLAASVGGLEASDARETYSAQTLPVFAPPPWLFGPTWTVLYALIAVAAFLVWRREGWDRSLTWWVIQLALNAAWTPLYFAGGLYLAAAVLIVVLLATIVWTTWLFWQRSRVAGLLMVPYIVWVVFASMLNIGIVVLN